MSILQKFSAQAVVERPSFTPGDTLRIFQKIREGEKTRLQVFEGLVIRIGSGYGADRTFTVRKVVDGIGVEKIFPLYSPNIDRIEVKKIGKVRRSKLYYMRKRSGKSARLQEEVVQPQKPAAAPKKAEAHAEAPVENQPAPEAPAEAA